MAIVGSLPGSWNGSENYQSSKLQVGIDGVVPSGYNQLTSLHAYVAREGGAGTVTLCCWRGNTIIASLAAAASASGGGGAGAQSWCGGSITPVAITPGETLRMGFQHNTAAFWDWSWQTGGNHFEQDATGNWTGATATGIIGAYGDVGVLASLNPSLVINGVWVSGTGRILVNGAAARLVINGTTAQR